MTTIPLAAALALLAKAHDVVVEGQPTTESFTFDPHIDDFMGLTATDDTDTFDYVFLKEDNAEVQINGDQMTLIDTSGDEPLAVDFRLMVPLQLEPVAVGEIHKYQCELEDHLNYILQHVVDAEEVGRGSFDERRDEVKRHARIAKKAFDWLDNYTILVMPRETDTIPPKILAALLHVREHFPEVDRVVYWSDTRWQFSADGHHTPDFADKIDISILNDAVYDLPDSLPAAYQLDTED